MADIFTVANYFRLKTKAKMTTTLVKPIEQTEPLKGQYAQKFIEEAVKKPSETAILRNQKASQLLKKMRS